MEKNKKMIAETREMWRALNREIKNNKNFNFEIFESAFNQTYALLAERATEPSLDKQYVQLIAEAYLFASIQGQELENVCLAATVLTDRMLRAVAFSSASEMIAKSVVFVLEAHEEILLDFNDVNDSVSRLVKVYEGASWKQLHN